MTTKETTGIHRSTLIDAPVERVFAYYSEPENPPEIWPSLIEVKDVTYAPEGWPQRFRWVYKMAGMKFEGNCEHVVFEKNSRIVGHNKGGIESTIEVTF
nr:SRPBCC family protein [Deinococcota bacterium]